MDEMEHMADALDSGKAFESKATRIVTRLSQTSEP